jgi:hypothetical protein
VFSVTPVGILLISALYAAFQKAREPVKDYMKSRAIRKQSGDALREG